ncbi:hypothetical protein OBBRIDRAFT_834987 [Obba rivulosa]|uniref:Ig-like domain-containing protein n=1 Tax=Obba rivulosa TaxID=1052685 RepID=A0A8E2DKI4_9APHY|nr:hypothetical protein OBBRIDRAFT_834987 [Obba rivulosa]
MRHRPPYLAFASTFYTVTELRLSCIKLWSSRDFLRLVCAFPSLRALSSFDVSWDRDEGRTLAEEPFAKALCLQKIEISDRENISPYKCLLSAPELLQSIKYVEFSKGGRSNWSVELTLQETSPLGETPVCHHPSRKAHAVVRDKYGSRGPPVEWLRGSFDLLDVFLISPSVSCVDIDVEMKIPDEALLNVLRTDPFPFPALRARGVLQVTAFSGLDIKTLEWGCTDIFIRRRQVED